MALVRAKSELAERKQKLGELEILIGSLTSIFNSLGIIVAPFQLKWFSFAVVLLKCVPC